MGMKGTIASAVDSARVGRGGVGGGGRAGPILQIIRQASSAEEQLATLREVKNSLVGDDEAKRAALGLFVVEDILAFLDVAARDTSDCHYESALLQAIGLFAILSSPPRARGLEAYLAPSGSRIVEHIIRALDRDKWSSSSFPFPSSSRDNSGGDERLTAIALKALCACVVPLTTTITSSCCSVRTDAAAAKKEGLRSLTALRKASGLILAKTVATSRSPAAPEGGRRKRSSALHWSPSSTTLGVEALAAMTRVEELARSLVPGVVSMGSTLLRPFLARRYRELHGSARAVAAGRVAAMDANYVPALLELLVNLACADPHAISAWLTNGTLDDQMPGSVLKGLEMELNSGDEKVRVLAGLVLVSCFKSSKAGVRRGPAAATTPSSPRALPHQSTEAPAVDEVIAHRVLPLFFRTLSSWSALPSTHGGHGGWDCGGGGGDGGDRGNFGGFVEGGSFSPSRRLSSLKSAGNLAAGGFAGVCGVYASAVLAAVAAVMELGPLQRQREAVAYGAVDSLVAFLRRARTEAMAARPESFPSQQCGSPDITATKDDENSTRGENTPSVDLPTLDATAAAAAAAAEPSLSADARFIRTAAKTGLNALASLCSRCEPARERTVGLGFHSIIGYWLAKSPLEEGDNCTLPLEPSSCSSNGGEGVGGSQSSSSTLLLAALLLVRNLGRSSVACSALVGFGVHESLLGILKPGGGGCDGSGADSTAAAGAGEGEGEEEEEEEEEEEAAGEAEEKNSEKGAGINGGARAESRTAAATEREALASAGLANMALEHEAVKEAVVGSETCLQSICKSALDLSADRKNARLASIAVLKSTCFLASLRVRVKVAHFLGGVNGMLGLLQGPRNQAVLQGLYTLRNLLNGIPLWAVCRWELGATPTPSSGAEKGLRDRDPGPITATAGAAAAAAAAATVPAPAAGEQREGGRNSPAGAGGRGGGSPAPPAAVPGGDSGSSSPDWRRPAPAPADEGGWQQRRSWQGWRGYRSGGGLRANVSRHRRNPNTTANNNNNFNYHRIRNFLGEFDSPPPLPSARGRGEGGSRGGEGRGGNWGRGDGSHASGGRNSSAFDGGRPVRMDVVDESDTGGADGAGSGSEGGALVARTGRGRGGRQENTAGLAFLRLMEAVLGTLGVGVGGGQGRGDCDEISCAALRLLHALSTSDDSQRAALRTPRVLHAALSFFSPASANDGKTNSNTNNNDQPLESPSPDSSTGGSLDDRATTRTTAASTAVSARAAANVAARLLLTELLPQRSGEGDNNSITAALAVLSASGSASGAGAGAGAGAGGITGWTGGAGGRRRARATAAGAWCSGLEFDGPAAGANRPGED